MALTYDVIVLGLGGMGSAAAHRLAVRGARVLGLEQFSPAHTSGSSHGGSRIIRQAYFEDPAYVPLLLRSYELFWQLERDSGHPLRTLCGGLMTGRPDSQVVSGSLRSARQWDLPHDILDAKEVTRRFPTMTPGEDEIALYEPRAGLVRPEATVTAQLELAARHGAELRFGEPVLRWETLPVGTNGSASGGAGGTGVRVHTPHGIREAGALVICPGAWAPRQLGCLGVPFTVERQVMYWFMPRSGIGPYTPDRHPVYIWEDPAGVQIYGFPALDGEDGGVKTAFFRKGTVCQPESIDRTVAPEEAAAMAEQLADRLPGLPDRLLRAVTCMYTTTPDEHFVIAPHPASRPTVVACGFSGHGFKFTPVVGEILAELALTGATQHPIELFDPGRFTAAPTPARRSP